MVGESMAHFAQQPVQTKPLQKPSNPTPTPPRQQGAQPTRRQPTQRMFSAQESLQDLFVLLQERIEPPITAALWVTSRPAQARRVLLADGVLAQTSQPLTVAFDPSPHQVRQIPQTVDALFHYRQTLLLAPVPMYHLPVVLEKRHVIGRHLQPEDASGFVVKLHRGRPETVLEPQAGMASSQMAVDL